MGNRKRATLSAASATGSSAPALVLDQAFYDRSGKLPAERNRILDGCRLTFERILGTRQLSFGSVLKGGGHALYYLTGGDAVEVRAGKRRYQALPLDDAPRFWVACTLQFRSELLKAQLIDLSIVFFQGPFTGRKQPILRAEWDCVSFFSKADHAQPHWHVYQEAATERELKADDFDGAETVQTLDEPAEPSEQLETTNVGGSNFHLAMASRWDEGGTHRIPFTEDGVTRWVEGCVRYARSQLTEA